MLPVRLRVVAAVGYEDGGSASRPPALPAHGRNRLHQREQLGDVVAVRARENACERNAVRVRDQMVLRTCLAPVDGARPGLCAPKSARSEAESQTAREKSSRST